MNINKLVALIIATALLLGPINILYYTDGRIVDGATEIGLFLSVIIGFFVMFFIGTNEPIGKGEEHADLPQNAQHGQNKSKAA